jgi:molybdopterin molybdotransferase
MEAIRKRLEKDLTPLDSEVVAVADGLGRIAAEAVTALYDVPGWDESLRDGFVIGPGGPLAKHQTFNIEGEIAAGCRDIPLLAPGQAYRIFTGGAIPEGGRRVVPSECCQSVADVLTVPGDNSAAINSYIKKRGCEIRRGEMIFASGARIDHDQLLFASHFYSTIKVAQRPQIRCFCTGSELVEFGQLPQKGQKHSLNSLLLGQWLPRYGGYVRSLQLLPDRPDPLREVFATARRDTTDMLITTGGTGPGKYDLVMAAFAEAGGELILDSLPMRPGKFLLLGKLGQTVFVGLPGPPQAVRTLMAELVGPLLLLMQGADAAWPKPLMAETVEELTGGESDVVQFKAGVLMLENGKCLVRMARRLESVNCFIALPPGCGVISPQEMVEVHRC